MVTPTTLLLSVIVQREGIPFPAVVEVLVMELTFEILREAGVRMPRVVGQMVSIVGALVIGQAAAEAGIISNIMIINCKGYQGIRFIKCDVSCTEI
jgi:spore germination protein KA